LTTDLPTETVSTDEKPRKPWQFGPGNNANPKGRPKGSRNQLGEDFLKALHDSFKTGGVAAIEACRQGDPVQYVKIIASILPKELNVKLDAFEEMTDDELIDRIRTLEGAVNAALGRTGETTDGTKAPDRHAEAGEVSALH
jgi:hypothetical protein